MTGHIYSVGQRVSFDGRVITYLRWSGVFTVTKLLPAEGAELQYRVVNPMNASRASMNFMPWSWKSRSLWPDRNCRR